MKSLFILVTVVLMVTGCKKDTNNIPSNPTRKVKFVLYTNIDFSGNNDSITFSVSIKKLSNISLWDSTFAPMLIKDIPNEAHKIVIEKLVPNNDTATLKVGFYYNIKNVGNSWHIDSFATGSTFKVVDFNFQ